MELEEEDDMLRYVIRINHFDIHEDIIESYDEYKAFIDNQVDERLNMQEAGFTSAQDLLDHYGCDPITQPKQAAYLTNFYNVVTTTFFPAVYLDMQIAKELLCGREALITRVEQRYLCYEYLRTLDMLKKQRLQDEFMIYKQINQDLINAIESLRNLHKKSLFI